VFVPPEDRMTEFRVRVAVMPDGGGLIDRDTFPENVSRLLRVMVEFRAESKGMTSLVGSALMSKSRSTTKVATVCVVTADPLVPVTLTL